MIDSTQVEDKLRSAGVKAGELGDFLTSKAKEAFSLAEKAAKEIILKRQKTEPKQLEQLSSAMAANG